jgi:hypothetical protein
LKKIYKFLKVGLENFLINYSCAIINEVFIVVLILAVVRASFCTNKKCQLRYWRLGNFSMLMAGVTRVVITSNMAIKRY